MSGILNSTGAVSGILGTTVGTPTAGNYVKTGSVNVAASHSFGITSCFSTTYGSYMVNGHFWDRVTSGGYALKMQLKSDAGTLGGANYNEARSGRNTSNAAYYGGLTGGTYWLIEPSLQNTAGVSVGISFMIYGTHETDANCAYTGTIWGDAEHASIGGEHDTEATVITGLQFTNEGDKVIDAWINVYGITGDYS